MAVGVLGAGQAQAVVVNVNGQQWDVTTYTKTRAEIFSTNTLSGLLPPGGLSKLPWWTNTSNETLAAAFSNAVNSALGVGFNSETNGTDEVGLPQTGGPWFLYRAPYFNSGVGYRILSACYWSGSSTICPKTLFDSPGEPGNPVAIGTVLLTDVPPNLSDTFAFTFAQATPYSAPAPGPLPVLGAAAAFGFSCKLRKRIKANTNPVSSTFSL